MSTPIESSEKSSEHHKELTRADYVRGIIVLAVAAIIITGVVLAIVFGGDEDRPTRYDQDASKTGDYPVVQIDYKQGSTRHSSSYCHLTLSDSSGDKFEVHTATKICKDVVPGDIIPVKDGKPVDTRFGGDIIFK